MRNAIIIGATSTIASSVINNLVGYGYNFYLFARNNEQLQEIKQNLLVKSPNSQIYTDLFDAKNDSGHLLVEKLNQAFITLGHIDLIFIAHGTLPIQQSCEESWDETLDALMVNGISVIEICHYLANKLQEQGYGTLAVISSVAGERGRQSNYTYGAAKGLINIYLQGLRNLLYSKHVHVLTIMPGFVDTKMTEGFNKGGILWTTPDKVGKDIVKAIFKRKNVLYTPWFWRYIMLIIKIIPESIFKKLKL